MANPLFQEITKTMNDNNIMSQFNLFKSNPMQFLLQRNINVPEQYINDPQAAVQHLLNNGSMSQDTFNILRNTAKKMGINI